MISALDRSAVQRGFTVALIGVVPAVIMLLTLGDDDNTGTDQSNWVNVALALIVIGYAAGGAAAARHASDSPFMNGAAAAFFAFAIPQLASVIVNVAQGDGVTVVALIFNGMLAPSIGIVGAGIGIRRGTLDDGGGEPAG